MSLLPARKDESEERAWASAGKREHARMERKLRRWAGRVLELLKPRPVAEELRGQSVHVMWLRVDERKPLASQFADFAYSVNRYGGGTYVRLELPTAVEIAVRRDRPDGSVRIHRYFDIQRRGMITDVAVGFLVNL